MERITRDELFIEMAKLIARRSTCDRGSVGCVIVKDHRVISMGYNGSLPGHDECTANNCDVGFPCQIAVHAEANAIAWAAKEGISIKDSTIYCTHLPCQKCAELIVQSGIREVIYSYEYRTDTGLSVLRASGIAIKNYRTSDDL